MNYSLFVLFEIITLFFLSRFLTRTLSQLIHHVTGSTKSIVYGIAFLFLPGTLVHELSHLFMAKILFVHTGDVSLFPHLEGDSLKLGSVEIEKTDPFRKFLIGVAPFLVGITLLFTIFYFLSKDTNFYTSWKIFLAIIATFEITNTMFSSKKDMEGTLALFVVILVIGIFCYFLKISPPEVLTTWTKTLFSLPFFQSLSFYLLFPIGVNLLLLFCGRVVLRRA